ncbi:MAG: FAD-dependent oxidoreductase [Candidatus Methanoperedens sp.]|nr:FAD-dependent oxidoreductase [Candidatus Methanoperedens sp.]
MANIVIIGLGSGGFAATLAARRTDSKSSITIIEKRAYEMFSPCGMPFAIEGIVSLDDLRFSLPDDKQITKLLEHEAQAINSAEKKVVVKNLKTCEIVSVPYDSLIIASGAEPFIPSIKGAKENIDRGVFVLHDIESARKIIEHAKNAKKAVVVGAGPIGLEIAAALRKNGLDVAVVEMLSHAFPRALDRDMAKVVEQSVEESQIKLLFNKTVSSVNGSPVESVSIGDEIIETDMVVLASGVRANLDTARNAGIETGRWGIKTNARMETNAKGIYAVGDCTETVSLIDHRPTVMQLSSAAYRQGMVAGTNAAGGYDTYEGALLTFASLIGKLEVAATGFNEFFAQSAGYKIISGKAHGKNKPDYYPGAKDITVKIIADAKTGKVLGGQVVGEGAGARINVISLAIKCGIDVYTLSQTEMAYCPMLAENYDVLNKASDFAVRKLEKGR